MTPFVCLPRSSHIFGAFVLVSALVCACQGHSGDFEALPAGAGGAPRASSSLAPTVVPEPYPTGRWRLMTEPQMASTIVYLSHILIAHRDVTDTAVSFARLNWRSTVRSTRSRDEALALAASVAAEVRQDPDGFARAARLHSDDWATRDRGGSLGGLTVLQLQAWGGVLDALSALEFGEVSRVVETQHGFHVLLRRSPPAAETLSGAHLVIGYDDAGWLRKVVARGPVPSRTRARALELAQSLTERAREAPDQFAVLVDRHSEHRDAEEGGDLGVWSTLAPSSFAREVEVLSQLPIGGISEPIDSLFGFEILQRTAVRERKEYAMSAIAVRFELSAPDEAPDSRPSARRLATRLAETVRREPDRFEAIQREYCCKGITRFSEGRAYPGVARMFEHMAIGEIWAEPIEAAGQFIIPKRARLEPKVARPIEFDLGFTGPLDVAYLLSHMDAATAQAQLSDVSAQLIERERLDADGALRLREALQRPWESGETSVAHRQAALVALATPLEQLLGGQGYSNYRMLMERQLERLLLRVPQRPGDPE